MGIFRNASTSAILAKMAHPLLSFVLILLILHIGQHVLIPFSFSCLLAILLAAPSRRLEKWGVSRGFAALICLLLAMILFSFVFYFISSSIVSFRNDFPLMVQNIQQAITDIQVWLHRHLNLSTEKAREFMNSSTSNVLPKTSVIVNAALSAVSGAFLTGVVVFLQTFLLLLYRSQIVKFFVSLFAEEFSSHIYKIMNRIRFVIHGYIIGLFIEMLAVAFAYCSALFIIGVKYAILLGVIGAILNLIPYLGIFVACLFTALITFSTNTPSAVLWSVVAILVIHLTDANILLPKIVGSKIKINAMTTIMGVIIGEAIWGIPGMFLAVPGLAILKVIFEDIPAFLPFAVLMDDDHHTIPTKKPVLQKLAKKVAAAKQRKKAP
ncbi:AI-2E family transporter [Flavisolibacter nicotianae]|uniref:AI-2E family transporter n=1 Tax=Flavisolibacter nicotianae TaxID=2364882 RepID=UPI000EB38F4C|nr:AI-2E family transporter [Flavisolibacter nicotianae]